MSLLLLNDTVSKATQWYGIEFDTTVSSPICKRVGNNALHHSLPIQGQMKTALLADTGAPNYFLNPLDWTKKEVGTSANLTGADGQVMTRIPRHWRRILSKGTARQLSLSAIPQKGFTYVPEFWVGSFEGSVQRSVSKLCSVVNTTADYRGGSNNATWDAETRTLLGRPATSISRIDFRTFARNRGSVNWNIETYDAYKSRVFLYLVQHANLNSQAAFNAEKDNKGFTHGGLGNGVTDIDGTKWNAWNGYNPFIPCGASNSLGNYSGEVSFNMPSAYDATIRTTKVNRFNGIENPFGHNWKFIDGINIEFQSIAAGGLSKVWVCSNPANFSNTGYAGYTLLGNMARADGYIKEMMAGELMPILTTGGGSTTYWCDYGYCANIPESGTDLRAVLFGGAAHGAYAGLGFSNTYNAPSYTYANFGSRLCFLGT